jgi:hypothetical protein
MKGPLTTAITILSIMKNEFMVQREFLKKLLEKDRGGSK